ncbi:MAG: hypothetical protein AB7G06_08270 [Bdellovibrionales bacterium]
MTDKPVIAPLPPRKPKVDESAEENIVFADAPVGLELGVAAIDVARTLADTKSEK